MTCGDLSSRLLQLRRYEKVLVLNVANDAERRSYADKFARAHSDFRDILDRVRPGHPQHRQRDREHDFCDRTLRGQSTVRRRVGSLTRAAEELTGIAQERGELASLPRQPAS